uniref:SH2 domain-containing protein n=1 Tax=Periophthalmus magnuspinnatus TaxID=409849 RepID=A0A3B4ACD9_9GOBI
IDEIQDADHTQGPIDGSLYARVRKKDSLEGTTDQTIPATGPTALPAVDHTLSVSSDSGNSTASIKTDRTDEHSQSLQGGVSANNPAVTHPSLSPQEKRELDQLLSGLEPPNQRQAYLSTSTSPGGGVRHLVPAQVHVNGGHNRAISAPTEERETDILDDELPNSQEGNSVDSLGTISSLDGQATPADLYYQSQTPVSQNDGPYLERGSEKLTEMPVHGSRTPTAMQDHGVDSPSPQGGYNSYQNGNGMYRSQSFGNQAGSSPETNPKLMPRAPERSTSSREAVQRGLNNWHQYSLPDDPFGPPLHSTHSLPHFPTTASQRDIEQSIEALNMLMLDLDPINSHMSKSHSAPTGENNLSATQVPFSQTLARPSYQADSAIHGYNNNSGPVNSSPVMESPAFSPQRSNAGYQNSTPSQTPEPYIHSRQKPMNSYQGGPVSHSPDLQGSSPYTGYSASSSPIPAHTPQPKETSSTSLAREQDPEEELNLEGLVAHRIAGVRSRGMTPEVTQETGRRRTTSEGQYQSSLENRSGVNSPDFAQNLALNPGGRPREFSAYDDLMSFPGRTPPGLAKTPLSALGMKPHGHGGSGHLVVFCSRVPIRPGSPEGSQVNIMGLHTVPGSPNTLHRTVATNTPPSPALQRHGYPDIKMNVKFVQDTSKFWYKPDISREQAINLLKDREPGAFIIRDSHSFRGAYGLAMKVACPPPTIQQNKKVGDMTNELVRHFLIETSPKGVRLKGCPNEPYFGCLSALVYQHSMTPLALPCKLMIPTKDPNEEALELATPTDPVVELLKQGAACNVLYINSVDMESLTGPQAIAKAITQTLSTNPLPAATTVHFKVSAQGITLTDSHRKIFFRRHYPLNTVTFCDIDPQDRKWGKEGGGSVRLFGFVARKQGSTTDNVSHLFAELEPDQPASAIVSFVSRMMKR